MSLLTILVVLIAVGVILYVINAYIPLDGRIKNILNIVVIAVVAFWLLKALGVFDALSGVTV